MATQTLTVTSAMHLLTLDSSSSSSFLSSPSPSYSSTSFSTRSLPTPAEPIPQQPKPQPSAGLLTIPLEIRYEIYAYLLHVPSYSRFTSPSSSSKDAVHTAILLANRQINREATAFLYEDNTFLAHASLLTSFPRLRPNAPPVCSAEVVPRIRRFHLTLHLDCDPAFDADAAEKSFSGLDELTIHLVQASFRSVGCANLRRFEGVRGIGRVAIVGSTAGFEEYLTWLRNAMMSEPGSQVDKFVPSGPSVVELFSIRYYI